MKVVNYSINTFYVLKMAINLRSLKLFLKKWEFKRMVAFQVRLLSRETTGKLSWVAGGASVRNLDLEFKEYTRSSTFTP